VMDPAAAEPAVNGGPVRPPSPLSDAAAAVISFIDAGSDELAASLRRTIPDLIEYQSQGYARRYADLVAMSQAAEQKAAPGAAEYTVAVADNLYKLMAYKDEYEVARLALDPGEKAKLAARFGDDAKVIWKLHPPLLRELGLRRKISLGPWFTFAWVMLRWGRRLRGTPFDLFGYTRVRKTERSLIVEYIDTVQMINRQLTADNHVLATKIAALPDMIRGYEQIKLDNVSAYRDQLTQLTSEFHTDCQQTRS
jgi:indolepyruvate ferredoxin oxidoreductase